MKFASISGAALALLCAVPGHALTYSGTLGAGENLWSPIQFDPVPDPTRSTRYSIAIQFEDAPASLGIWGIFTQSYDIFEIDIGRWTGGNDTTSTFDIAGAGGAVSFDFLDPGSFSTIGGNEIRRYRTLQLGFVLIAKGADAPINYVVTTSAFGVPEPAAWAMLIAGFGLVGSALRSVKRRPHGKEVCA